MIRHFTAPEGHILVEIHCGCCGIYFLAPIGGTCFCQRCMNGNHLDCKVLGIMGGKS